MSERSIPVVSPPPELTDDTVADFETLMATHVKGTGPGVIVDLDGVAFISSAGLGCLVKIGMRLDGMGRRLALARPDRNVERSLRLIGLQSKLPMFPSVQAAANHIADNHIADNHIAESHIADNHISDGHPSDGHIAGSGS